MTYRLLGWCIALTGGAYISGLAWATDMGWASMPSFPMLLPGIVAVVIGFQVAAIEGRVRGSAPVKPPAGNDSRQSPRRESSTAAAGPRWSGEPDGPRNNPARDREGSARIPSSL